MASTAIVTTVPSPPSFRYDNNESTGSLLTGRSAELGSRFSLSDDWEFYISSRAVTLIISSVATIGSILVAVIISLAMLVNSCENQYHSETEIVTSRAPDFCSSFQLNSEINNIQGWTLPELCESHVSDYIYGGQYHRDFAEAVNSARKYLKTQIVGDEGRDAVVLAVDETLLSNIPYYRHGHWTKEFNEDKWNVWVEQAKAPAMLSMLALYRELKVANWSIILITGRPEYHRSSTTRNLLAAGYEAWTCLIFRSADEIGLTAQLYKSVRRLQLEKKGYRIRSALGDQWSDIMGPAVGNRTFKLPNPMYYTI